jgi:formylglycine-generating enzyme required for sulfatase activity
MARSVPRPSLACLLIGIVVAACSPGGPATSDAQATEGPSAAPSPQPDPGTTRIDAQGIDQVWVPGGVFQMGSDDGSATPPSWAAAAFDSEHPAHEVAITRGYWIDLTEVTVGAHRAFVDAGGYDDESLWSADGWAWRQAQSTARLPRECVTGGQEPVEPQVCVSWFEAEAYAWWRGGRLPTEAEWEFAARGPESRVYPWGNEYDAARANLDGGTGPVAVGSYPEGRTWVGALDMAGNAMEWVADWYSRSYYEDGIRDDPTGPATGTI